MPGPRAGRNVPCAAGGAPVHDGMDGRDVPIPVAETRRSHLAGIVIGGMGKITRRWSRNDPCGSCGGGAVGERLDLRVHDSVALDEIELYAEVLSAVAVSDHPLTLEELDEVLGI